METFEGNRASNIGTVKLVWEKPLILLTGFRLRQGGTCSLDASWVRMERWNTLTEEQRKKFLPLCPDFVVELVSETDNVEETRLKMQDYINNRLQLGWLINLKIQPVEIYRPNQSVEVL